MEPRPKSNSAEVITAAAERLLPSVLRWLNDASCNRDEVCGDLCAAMRWHGDGYEIAKQLDDRGWSPDAELVEILNEAGPAKWDAHAALVKEWVAREGVKLTIATHADVKTSRGNGKIVALRTETAEYVVQPPNDPRFASGGGWIVPAEDCHPIPGP